MPVLLEPRSFTAPYIPLENISHLIPYVFTDLPVIPAEPDNPDFINSEILLTQLFCEAPMVQSKQTHSEAGEQYPRDKE